MSQGPDRKLLLIGWDAADWKAIDPLMDQGLMPNLERMVNEGVRGSLATLDPPLSPMLWTSIATGKRPYKHGVLGFTEVAADGKTIRPVTNVHRKVKAIWNILMQEGKRSNVIGWWPSHPAEPINGIMVSNFYQRADRPITEPWPMREGTVHPSDKSELFAGMRIHPAELTGAHIAPFVPGFARMDQSKDRSLESLARIIADCSTVHAAATYMLEHEPWDMMCVYYDAIDHFAHGFMKYHPPRRDFIPEDKFELFKEVITSGYRYHDMMLGRLLELAGPGTTVMLISDHGFHPDHLRPRALPREPAAPAREHSPFGIFCAMGPGIKKDALIHGAGLLDITPTILTLFGAPVARDMDGKPLLDIFEERPEPEVIESWEQVPGECGMHAKRQGEEVFSDMDKGSLQQLVELGYIDDPGNDPELASLRTIRENRFFLSKAYLDGGRIHEAAEELRKLVEEAPEMERYGRELVRALLAMDQAKEARTVLDVVREAGRKAYDARRKEEMEKVDGRDIGAYREPNTLRLLEINILLKEGDARQALTVLERLVNDPRVDARKLQVRMGDALLKLGRWNEALAAFERAIGNDPRSAAAYHGAGVCLLKMDRTEDAMDMLHQAVALRFDLPLIHYHLGETYWRLGHIPEAEQAFLVALRMAPGLNRARLRLANIYKNELGTPERADALMEEVRSMTSGDIITVVSGLPRSGTSLMMQSLVAGGMEAFTDGERKPDENNPKGYFEHRSVRSLATDNAFIRQARGKVVKVVAPLLAFLPPRYRYRVIFMERDLDEVLLSQNRMIDRSRKPDRQGAYRVGLSGSFRKQLESVHEWEARNPTVEMIRIPFAEVIGSPREAMEKVNAFLGGELDVDVMVSVVDPALHRSHADARPE
ncbi:MAG: alkaline phosphatase family protein [Flavobacteriales bacterium]|nr:alkaline phosphatase family protein [Flavobacteriales bacterium]